MDCEKSSDEAILYLLLKEYSFVFLLVYIGDARLFGKDGALIAEAIHHFHSSFEIHASRRVDKFLAI